MDPNEYEVVQSRKASMKLLREAFNKQAERYYEGLTSALKCDLCKLTVGKDDIKRHKVSPGEWRNVCRLCEETLELREGR